MDFNNQKPIFLQIYDLILERTLKHELIGGERIASVREMASTMLVNPNTVQRAYTELQNKGILTQQRGIGYFLTQDAQNIALSIRKDEFLRIQLPSFLHQMQTLGISWDEIQSIRNDLIVTNN